MDLYEGGAEADGSGGGAKQSGGWIVPGAHGMYAG